MINVPRLILIIVLGIFLHLPAACSHAAPSRPTIPVITGANKIATVNLAAERTVRQFIAAYNAKNLDGMMALVDASISWLAIDGSDVSAITQGADMLRAELEKHLGPDASPRSNVKVVKSHGDFVITLERAYWNSDGVEKSQASFAMYEVKQGIIMRIWYFPAQV